MKKAAKKSAMASIASALVAILTVMAGVAVEGLGPNKAQAQRTNRTTPRFYCDESEKDPKTIVSTPEGEHTVIIWETRFFGPGYPPLRRCQIVSGRFQRFQEESRWKYITHGKLNDYPIICFVEYRNQECKDDEQLLFTLKKDVDDPKKSLQRILDIRDYGTGTTPFYHTGEEVVYEQNGRIYIHIDELISKKRRESIRRDNP